MEAGRNDLCPCGSGRKYKKCCMETGGPARLVVPRALSPDPFGLERQMAWLERHVQRQGCRTEAEVEAYVQALRGQGAVPAAPGRTPAEQAQDLVYEAVTRPPAERPALARRALELDAGCADACGLMAEAEPDKAVAWYERAVAATPPAEPRFSWQVLATRPHLRARFGLAHALWAAGRQREAVSHLEALYTLHPEDALGVRYWIIDWLFRLDDGRIMEWLVRCEADPAAMVAWSRVLWAYRQQAPMAVLMQLLAVAQRVNPHVPAALAQGASLPAESPAQFALGSPAEAADYAIRQRAVWASSEGALEWLAKAAAL